MIVNSIVIKVASRCNLNCTYCYVYNLGDTSYKSQPKFMSLEDVNTLIERVIEHCKDNNVKYFNFVFHGGEPMLQTKEFYTYFINRANEQLGKESIEPIYTMQTNGLLMTKDWCTLFNDLNIQVGISLDGYKEINDKARIDHKGKGSYDRIIKGLKIAQQNLTSTPGILSVVDVNSDPIKFYQNASDVGVDYFDLLWPHATYDQLPENYTTTHPNYSEYNATPYADWLIKIFDVWYTEKGEHKKGISLFDTIINLILGNIFSGNEDFGKRDTGVLVIETNGDIEVVGALKLCGNGFTKSGANINTTSFSEAFQTKLASLYYKSHNLLNKKCTSCPLVDICGGGHIHTRYKKENGFDNPSVYCNDFMKLITHIQNAIYDSLPDKYKNDLDKITYKEVKDYMDGLELEDIETPDYAAKLKSF